MCQKKYVPAQSGSATNGCVSSLRDGEVRGEAEDAERRRPLGEDDVLQQVHREQVVERDRVQRRDEDRQDQREAGREAGDSPARHAVAPDDEQVPDRERRNEDERLEIQRPGVRIVHRRTLRYEHAGVAQW